MPDVNHKRRFARKARGYYAGHPCRFTLAQSPSGKWGWLVSLIAPPTLPTPAPFIVNARYPSKNQAGKALYRRLFPAARTQRRT